MKLASIAFALGLAALPAAAQTPDRILRVIPSADLAELDPTRGANLVARIYSQMVFDTLFALDSNLAPKPMMVDRETVSPDGLLYTFTLRPGLKFHDGRPVTTRDVVASLDRWDGRHLDRRAAQVPRGGDGGGGRPHLHARAEAALRAGRVHAGRPRRPDRRHHAGSRRQAGRQRAAHPNRSAPARSATWPRERVSGHRAVFVRNPDYASRPEPTDGLAGARTVKVDRVEWTVIPDPTTAANALATGEADFWEAVAPDLAPFLRQRGVTVRRTAALPSVAFVRPDFALPPFNDLRARQALALLFDQNDFMAAVAGDNAKWSTCYSFSVCGGPLGTEVGSEPYRKPDLARAKQLFAEAGYRGEKLVLLGTPQLPNINAMTQVAAQRLREAGIDVDVQMTDFPTMLTRINAKGKPLDAGGYNLFTYYAVGTSWFHPLMNVSADLSCNPGWPGFPCDPEGEALRQAFLSAADEPARKAAFAAFQKRLWDFIPYVPAGQFDVSSAYRPNVTGVLDAYFIAYWNIEKR